MQRFARNPPRILNSFSIQQAPDRFSLVLNIERRRRILGFEAGNHRRSSIQAG
jgi:hypothetical protein